MTSEKKILNKFYLIAALFIVFAVSVGIKLLNIQIVQGKEYEDLAQKSVYKNFTIPANRGNLYDANGSLLATSVPKYDIRFDAVTVSQKDFDENLNPLSKALSEMLGGNAATYKNKLQEARRKGNRYLLIAKDLRYSDYMKIKSFPLFEKGPYKGGIITEQVTMRELPLGKIAERTVGQGSSGLEGAYNEYLKGRDGKRLKQKIAKGQWKPVGDANEIEPKDGLDVISTIDVNIQDIAHHALLKQLEKYEADHGTAIIMEVKTGEIKALANLGKTKEGWYYEKRNYGIWETQEPGSTFKLPAIVAALEDKVVDTATVFDSEGGRVSYYDRVVRDSDVNGYGKISAGRAFEVSSNTVFSKMITEGYENNAKAFVNRLEYMGLGQPIGLEIKGEGKPHIPYPGDKNWYGTTLPWMSFGYGVSMTPLQILNFYNAIANDGIQVKPKLIKEIRDRDRLIKDFEKPIVNNSICSKETAKIAQDLMKNAVEKGTASVVKSNYLTMAGKTGTAQTSYGKNQKREYTASFAGYFPAENPEYSCIVVVNQPNSAIGFYGGQVAAPAFKEIAEKMYNRTPQVDTVKTLITDNIKVEEDFEKYFTLLQEEKNTMPNVVGLSAMDALPLLENIGIKTQLDGSGVIARQSIVAGEKINENSIVKLIAN